MNIQHTISPIPSSLEAYRRGEIFDITCHHNKDSSITIITSGDSILGLGLRILEPVELVPHITIGKCHYDPTPVKVNKLKVCGTPFQVKVWQELLNVNSPITYKELAMRINAPKAYRAVANAVGANPISILIPCHRIIGCNGIGGYRWGVDKKRALLEWESNNN